MAEQLTLFDYAQLDAETRIVVQQEDKEFDRNMSDSGQSFVRSCKNVLRIHSVLKYKRPGFVDWCQSKPGLEKSTAYKMLDVAKMFPDSGNIQIDSKEALYLLAAPSTPDDARAEAIARAEAGERVTHEAAKEIVKEHKLTPEQEARLGEKVRRDVEEWNRQAANLPPEEVAAAKAELEANGTLAKLGLRPTPDADPDPGPPPPRPPQTPPPPPRLRPEQEPRPAGRAMEQVAAVNVATFEACPVCGEGAFYPDGGWTCDGCERRCSKLEAMYNHGPDVLCRACHIATHSSDDGLPGWVAQVDIPQPQPYAPQHTTAATFRAEAEAPAMVLVPTRAQVIRKALEVLSCLEDDPPIQKIMTSLKRELEATNE